MTDSTPRSNRLHITVYGRRNAGKSSLINFITDQPVALVSDTPGTTTDPVPKNMELLPIGPVVFTDTAGIDDVGDLGRLRVERTRDTLAKTDLAILVIPADYDENSLKPELDWLDELKSRTIPALCVMSQADRLTDADLKERLTPLSERTGLNVIPVSSLKGTGRAQLLNGLINSAPTDFERSTILGDLFEPGARIILVAPQDIQAPKGRLILPQVQVLRDILDHGGLALMVTANEFEGALGALKERPDLVVTDSQVFPFVDSKLPRDVKLTSFSILMARYKGELSTFVRGAEAIKNLKESDRVLIAEACTHHALDGDIGRQKLPGWLRRQVGEGLTVNVVAGSDFPADLADYSLILHCGACMFNRRQLMSRLSEAVAAGVPITNYGTAIAALNGMLERVVEIFPELDGKN